MIFINAYSRSPQISDKLAIELLPLPQFYKI